MQLSSEVDNDFILDFDQLQILQTTSLHYKSWVVLFLTSLLMLTSDNYFMISEKHLSAVNIEQRTKFLLQLAFKVCYFFKLTTRIAVEGQHIAAISNAAAVKNRVYVWQGVVDCSLREFNFQCQSGSF